MDHEWDWPPPRRPRATPTIEGRIKREGIVFTPMRAMGKRFGDHAADWFFATIMMGVKIVIGAALGLVLVGAIWLISAVLRV